MSRSPERAPKGAASERGAANVPDPPSEIALAAKQGVGPIENIDELLGDFWPEDEDFEEFLSTLRAWRETGNQPSQACWQVW